MTPSVTPPDRVHWEFSFTAALFFVELGSVPDSVLDASDESVVVAADPMSETPNDDDGSPVGDESCDELADDGR